MPIGALHAPDPAGSPDSSSFESSFDALTRELVASDALPSAAGFAPVLSINAEAMRVVGRCAACCHWSLPLSPIYRDRTTAAGVALDFTEWIVWAWHVRQHQRADRLNERAA